MSSTTISSCPSITHEQAFRFLSLKELKVKAPSAFTKTPKPTATAQYIPISTVDALEDLMSLGWKPIDAYEVNPKKEANKGYQKHFIRLRNEKKFVGTKEAIEVIPEILMVNSYDARCSFKLYSSLYRVTCNNGLVIKDSELDEIFIPHKGSKMESWSWEIYKSQLLLSADRSIDLMNRYRAIQLNAQQQKEFAQASCRSRWDYRYVLLEPKALLAPLREEDEATDLWTLFNVVQEKMVRGGWVGSAGRSIKPMVDRNRELIINIRLFQIAEEFYQALK